MKKYILTEEQLTRVLTEERPIKKGVAIKFSPGKMKTQFISLMC